MYKLLFPVIKAIKLNYIYAYIYIYMYIYIDIHTCMFIYINIYLYIYIYIYIYMYIYIYIYTFVQIALEEKIRWSNTRNSLSPVFRPLTAKCIEDPWTSANFRLACTHTRFEIVYSFDGILLLEIKNLVHECRRVWNLRMFKDPRRNTSPY